MKVQNLLGKGQRRTREQRKRRYFSLSLIPPSPRSLSALADLSPSPQATDGDSPDRRDHGETERREDVPAQKPEPEIKIKET